jgi:polysaccharide biosynthesis protein PslH
MHILYVSMMLPYPPTFGKRMEIWTTLRALANEGHELTLISFNDLAQKDVDLDALTTVCHDVELAPFQLCGQTRTGEYLRRLGALFSLDPYSARRFRSDDFRERVRRRLETARFDAVICGEVFMVPNIPDSCEAPVIVKKDHIAATILERHMACERNPVKKAYSFVEYLKTKRWEPMVCSRAGAIMACSTVERELLQRWCPGVPVTIAPNVVDTAAYEIAPAEDSRTILYHGLMDWYPNQDAVAFFISEILPPLRGMVPGIRFVVAGRSSSEAFQKRFAHLPEVEFTGTVPDMRPVIERCSVCVVPLRIASGTRFKILEAAAMGKPTVSTRTGAEGLDFVNGSEILLADDPQSFAKCVAGLLKDSKQRRQIGLAARNRVETSYSLSVLQRAVRETLAVVAPAFCPQPPSAAEMEAGSRK